MRLTEKKAIQLLKENGFEELSRKGSHVKYGKGKLRFVLTAGGWKGSGELHSKQTKDLLNIINNKETNKTNEEHSNNSFTAI